MGKNIKIKRIIGINIKRNRITKIRKDIETKLSYKLIRIKIINT